MTQKPKILVFAHEPYLNGASHSLLSILVGLQAHYEFKVIVPDYGLMTAELEKKTIAFEVINLPRCAYFNWVSIVDHLKKTIHYYKTKRSFEKQLEVVVHQFQPDLVYTNTSVMEFGYAIAKKYRLPHIWHVREYSDKFFNIEYLPSKKNIVNKMKNSAGCIFTTHILKEHWYGTAKVNAEVVYNGVLHKTEEVTSIQKQTANFTIAVVGNVIAPKNQVLALEIFNVCYKKNNKLRLQFYGAYGNAYYRQLLDYINRHSLNDVVQFLGYVPNTQIYHEIDLLLSCSENEAFGRTIIEAMSKKIPVLSKNIGGPSEILKEIRDYTLFNTLEEAVVKIHKLANDNIYYADASRKGYELASSNFTEAQYVSKIDSIFKAVLHDQN
ncbi:glycosyltransferase family 4 protein [Flavobacterium chuncheonense]|uniref:Glycosyltransferase family 4 protein n=1 Tax=Flavobacterium chuncheonense TaxID=2026653 RepID=A0ABW5YIZ3_9FLAO